MMTGQENGPRNGTLSAIADCGPPAIGAPPVSTIDMPPAAPKVAKVAMKGTRPARLISRPLTMPTPIPTPAATSVPSRMTRASGKPEPVIPAMA